MEQHAVAKVDGHNLKIVAIKNLKLLKTWLMLLLTAQVKTPNWLFLIRKMNSVLSIALELVDMITGYNYEIYLHLCVLCLFYF